MIVQSLKTASEAEAATAAHKIALEQDRQWEVWRSGSRSTTDEIRRAGEGLLQKIGLQPGDSRRATGYELPVGEFEDLLASYSDRPYRESLQKGLYPPHVEHAARLYFDERQAPTLLEAVEQYQKLTGVDRTENARRARIRTAQEVAAIVGDLPIDQYTRKQANELVEALLAKELSTSTIRRYLNYITPVINTMLIENEITASNAFKNLRVPGFGKDVVRRKSMDQSDIRRIQSACYTADDDMRWLIALVSDTGLRLAEAVGLHRAHIRLDDDVPHLEIIETPTRPLKTPSSNRTVPLVGAALWAARRITEETTGEHAFPRYSNAKECKATSASNACSAYFRRLELGPGKTMHSLRHAFRDRLREVGAEEEVADRLGGWSQNKTVGRGYGQGHSIGFLHNLMLRIVID
nr:tyrosine-type recombinase/integrase [Wenxinia marina]